MCGWFVLGCSWGSLTAWRRAQRNLLRRALSHAVALEVMAASQGGGLLDARSELEVAAYVQWLRGTLEFELGQWPAAMDALSHTRVAYFNLRASAPEPVQEIYSQRLDEVDAALRFCSYRAGGSPEDLAELIKVRSARSLPWGSLRKSVWCGGWFVPFRLRSPRHGR